jgi:hypothetical protein
MTGLAGELFVAAELLKRGLQASVTFGNAKAIDLLAHNPRTGRTFPVQVKALRKPNFFLLGHESVKPGCVYVFVLLNDPGQSVKYYIVPGRTLCDHPERFSRYFVEQKMPGIHSRFLDGLPEFTEAWGAFEEPEPGYGPSVEASVAL